ncbi:hypothetical protein SAMN05192564_102484 [Paraburkholderia sartisoli]|uniref:Uncharacterized protein n=1 Tax=Paraburkholderia sartisoli TaxID=83784 RepID=A0A1H4CTY1_9BURK|nr:hypothetical protein SAMN05192564_102484 [Paraburkholderia sartisoli]
METEYSLAVLRKKNRGVITRTVQDVKNVDALRLADDAVENLVTAMGPVPHASIFVARHKRESEGYVCEAQAFVAQFTHEAHGAAWIIPGYVIADGFHLGPCGRQDANDHALRSTIA